MKSHVQVPKGIIRLFEVQESSESPYIWSYDVRTKKISKSHAASLNTSKGYYSTEVEDYLCNEIEKPYIDLVHKIASDVVGTEDQTVEVLPPTVIFKTVLNYVFALSVRNPRMLELLKNDSVLLPLLDDQTQKYFAVERGIEILKKKSVFQNFGITMAVNHTNHPFILTMNGMAVINHPYHGVSFFVSATPKFCFIMVEKKDILVKEKNEDKNVVRLFDIQAGAAEDVNMIMCRQQMNQGFGFIASGDRGQLKLLVNAQCQGSCQ